MIYRKLKRINSHGYSYVPNFTDIFPELSHLDNEELSDRFDKLNMEFYYHEKTRVSHIVRLTLPFALILIILMFLFLPVNFMFTGKWRYEHKFSRWALNWFSSLGFHY